MIGTTLSIILLIYLCFKVQTTQKVINKILDFVEFISRGRWKSLTLKSKAEKMLTRFHESINNLVRHPKGLILPLIFSLLAWISEVLVSYFVFISLGLNVSFTIIIIVYTLGVTIQHIPVGIPAEVGLTEIFMTSLYVLLGIDLAISATATVLIRLFTVWFRFFVGYASLIRWIGTEFITEK